jgi:hypothetical protein
MTDNTNEVIEITEDWAAIPRISQTIPFGYKVDPDDLNVLLPIPLELEALKKAKQHVKRYSYRAVAQWLEVVTGRSISHVGLKKRLDSEQSRKYEARTVKGWATKFEQATRKAEILQNERLGART